MSNIFNKLFLAGDWKVCLFKNNQKSFIIPQKNYWYADPFLFTLNNVNYLFVEAFNKKKETGKLAVLSSKDNYSSLTMLLNDEYHYSFPNVFEVNKKIFMIPESSERLGIYLYEFEDFPNSIKLKKKLLDGEFVDTALLKIIDYKGLFVTYDSINKKLYSLIIDFENYEVKSTLLIDDADKQYRPAGNSFLSKGKTLVPFQNSKNKYGESIFVREVTICNDKVLISKEGEELSPVSFGFDKSVKRMHTLNKLSDNEFVVDCMVEKFSLLKSFKMLRRKLRRRRHKKELLNE